MRQVLRWKIMYKLNTQIIIGCLMPLFIVLTFNLNVEHPK